MPPRRRGGPAAPADSAEVSVPAINRQGQALLAAVGQGQGAVVTDVNAPVLAALAQLQLQMQQQFAQQQQGLNNLLSMVSWVHNSRIKSDNHTIKSVSIHNRVIWVCDNQGNTPPNPPRGTRPIVTFQDLANASVPQLRHYLTFYGQVVTGNQGTDLMTLQNKLI